MSTISLSLTVIFICLLTIDLINGVPRGSDQRWDSLTKRAAAAAQRRHRNQSYAARSRLFPFSWRPLRRYHYQRFSEEQSDSRSILFGRADAATCQMYDDNPGNCRSSDCHYCCSDDFCYDQQRYAPDCLGWHGWDCGFEDPEEANFQTTEDSIILVERCHQDSRPSSRFEVPISRECRNIPDLPALHEGSWFDVTSRILNPSGWCILVFDRKGCVGGVLTSTQKDWDPCTANLHNDKIKSYRKC